MLVILYQAGKKDPLGTFYILLPFTTNLVTMNRQRRKNN